MQWRWRKARRGTKEQPLGDVIDTEPETVRILDLTARAAEPEPNVTPSEGVPVAAAATKTTTRRAAGRPKTPEGKTPAKSGGATKRVPAKAAKSATTRSADSSRTTSAKPRVAKTTPRSK